MKPRLCIVFLVNHGWFQHACAPLFSDMQSVRLVGENQFETTPGYNSIGLSNEAGNIRGIVNTLVFRLLSVYLIGLIYHLPVFSRDN